MASGGERAGRSGSVVLVRPEVTLRDATEGEVFGEIGPMETEGSEFDGVELGGRAAGEARIFRDGEAEFHAARHDDDDRAVEVEGALGGVSQGVHAKESHR